MKRILTVAWISNFPVEWLPDLPEPLRALPRRQPATWQVVLLSEFEKDPTLHVHVIVLRHRIECDVTFERNGIVFHIVKARPAWRVGTLFWLDTHLIRLVCRKIRPDLVHAWGVEDGAALIASRLGYPYVMTVQGLFAWYKEKVPLPIYERFVERVESISLQLAPVVTTESSFAIRFLKERYPALRVQQAEHAPNKAFSQLIRRPQTNPIHFISIGTLGYRKGTDLLFNALDKLTAEMPFRVTVISGPNRDYVDWLRSTFPERLWRRVQFKQHILPHEVANEMASTTMLLLPTRADTSPNAVKEAVVAGVPVVASDIGGIPDYVCPGKNGFLFPSGDLAKFIRAIRSAYAHPLFGKGLVDAETLTQRRAYLSTERMASNFTAAYDTALAAKTNNVSGVWPLDALVSMRRRAAKMMQSPQ